LSLQQTEVQQVKPRNETSGTRNAARLKSNKQSQRHEVSSIDTYGTKELCAWRVAPSRFWFQTTRSSFARKLAKRRDARRVEVSGLNHYRRTFEIRGTRRKVRRIIKRFSMVTPDQFSGRVAAEKPSKIIPKVGTAGAAEGRG
jgi:hypothetical protein